MVEILFTVKVCFKFEALSVTFQVSQPEKVKKYICSGKSPTKKLLRDTQKQIHKKIDK